MKPNFSQAHVMNSLKQENDYLRAQAQAMAQTSRLIESAVTGLAAKYDDPAIVAEKAVQIAGAVIMALDKLSQETKDNVTT